MDVLRLCVWSGPRNVSTALMYSFAQREDTKVVDEPLYAHYLKTSGVDHPGRDEVLAGQDSDGERVVREVILGGSEDAAAGASGSAGVLFFKQMAHHLVGLDRAFLDRTVNVLLIRHPAEVLSSLVNQLPNPRLADTGMAVQLDLLQDLRRRGQEPAILDSRELLLDPRGVLTRLCGRLGIEFNEAMLSWEVGALREDGIWAPYWYDNVHRSTGFAPYRPKTDPFPERLQPLLEECRPYYDELFAHAIRASA